MRAWLFRFKHYVLGWHNHADNGNCWDCGYRYHGCHVGPYAEWFPIGPVPAEPPAEAEPGEAT